MDVDLADVERELCRIPEVRAARIVADKSGQPVEVHVLAAPGKAAKQVVRDVQSVAMATVGLELDHRIVSVVQLDETLPTTSPAPAHADNGAPPAAAPSPSPVGVDTSSLPRTDRVLFDNVVVVRRGLGARAEVVLRRRDETVTGTAEGSAAHSTVVRLVAQAALDALRKLEPVAGRVDVETVIITPVGEHEVVTATVVIVVPPNEELVSGSAPVRNGAVHEALARSVLDALNRRLPALR